MHGILGVKSYGFEWYLRYGLSETQVAEAMARHGIDWVALQNLRDPLPTSAVRQELPGPPYDDHRLRDELRARGLRLFEATAVFFRPQVYAARPDLRPVDAQGRTMEPFGWYIGLCPSSPDYLAERAAIIEEVAASLQPDGVFLSFIRFPGFWELWTPETTRAEVAEYCFCERCLERFQVESGQRLPEGTTASRAAILQHELRETWTDWKCRIIASIAESLRAAVQGGRPGAEVLVNGVALGRQDLGNAVEEVLGQRLEALSGPADHVELMFYHQILRRELAPWISSLVAEARPRTRATLLACLQVKADYLEPLYASGRRDPEIPLEEFVSGLRAVAASEADGAMVYHWLDVLENELSGAGGIARALRAFKDGSLL